MKIEINPDYKTWNEVIVSDDEDGTFIELTDYIPTKKTVRVYLKDEQIVEIYNALSQRLVRWLANAKRDYQK